MIPKDKTDGGGKTSLKGGVLKKKHKAKIVSVELVKTAYGEKYIMTFSPAVSDCETVWLNGTSLRKLVEKFSRDEKKWKGKSVIISPDKIMGKRCNVVSPS